MDYLAETRLSPDTRQARGIGANLGDLRQIASAGSVFAGKNVAGAPYGLVLRQAAPHSAVACRVLLLGITYAKPKKTYKIIALQVPPSDSNPQDMKDMAA
jgi:hypothetical protein